MLQKEKSAVPNFDAWYEPWREQLVGDTGSRWLNKARAQVVHQQDLATVSKARGSLIYGYGSVPFDDIEVPAATKTRDIVISFCHTAPTRVRQNGILSVERRWEVPDLPGQELLELLANNFGLLSRIVGDAHLVLDRSFQAVKCRTAHIGSHGKPSCLTITRLQRSEIVALKNGTRYNFKNLGLPKPRQKDVAVSEQKYGVFPAEELKDKHALDAVPIHHALSQRMLVNDGYRIPMIIFMKGEAMLAMQSFEVNTQAEKYIMWQLFAEQAANLGADSVVSTGEIWIARLKASDPLPSPEDAPDRTEGLQTSAATSDGRSRTIVTRFHHEGDAIVIDGTEDSTGHPNFLRPIVDIWRQQNE